ncbi:hypothetical protein KR084_001058, partial [Drosophila pseudotakahashii]
MLQTPGVGKRPASPTGPGTVGDESNRDPRIGAPLRVEDGKIVAQIKIADIPVLATVDSGATRSFINETLLGQLEASVTVREVCTGIRLADGTSVSITGMVVANLHFGGQTVEIALLVMNSMLDKVILGLDFLCAIGTTIRGYWQIPMAPDSKQYTAFTVPGRGLFQWRVMPFGLHSAAATFQRALDSVIGPELDPFAFAYLDDIVYLGHMVSEAGIHTDPDKVAAVKELQPPTSLKELRRCLGMASWYRRFVPNFATIVQPMTKLLRKSTKWRWDAEEQVAFDELKDRLTSAPTLACPNFDHRFTVQTDASDVGLGAVLTQETEGTERVIAYISRRLEKAEENYTTTEKECLAVVWAIRKWRCYLEGYEFTIITDHLALKWLNSIESPSGRIARWALELQQFRYLVTYRKGCQNVVADTLSRQPLAVLQRTEEEEEGCKWWVQKREQILANPEEFPDFAYEDGQIYRRLGTRPDDADFVPWKLCVPRSHRRRVLEECHDAPTAGHFGIRKTILRVASKYYWPGMYRDVKRYVQSCLTCQKFKVNQQKPAGHMLTRRIEEPCSVWCADFVGPLPKSK